MQIKGTFILDFVKIIRSNRDGNWDRWLEPEDWEIVNSQILPSNWYPLASWERIGNAVFKEAARGNLDLIRAYGPVMMKNLLNVYSHVLVKGDPAASIEKFEGIRRTFIKGLESNISITERAEGRVRLNIKHIYQDRDFLEAFTHATAGNIEELVKQAGGMNVSVTIHEAPEGYLIEVVWE